MQPTCCLPVWAIRVPQVGLPARGKTFLCNKLMCYLNWWVPNEVQAGTAASSARSSPLLVCWASKLWAEPPPGVRKLFLAHPPLPQAGPPHQALQRGPVSAARQGGGAPGKRGCCWATCMRATRSC